MKLLIAGLFAAALVFVKPVVVNALTIPASGQVVDNARVLSDIQENSLITSLNAEQSRSDTQIAILTINSLDGDSIESYSIKVARDWGIGSKDHDNGVLIVVAVKDRRVRIEVGRGLEGALTDAESGRIINGRITPEFIKGDYYAGLTAGIDGIQLAIADEFDPAALAGTIQSGVWPKAIFFGFFGLMWLASMLARSKSWWAGGIFGGFIGLIVSLVAKFSPLGAILALSALGLGLDFLVSKNYSSAKKSGSNPAWWAGGRPHGGSSSSGGFGGFGGGSFGGGGASGSW